MRGRAGTATDESSRAGNSLRRLGQAWVGGGHAPLAALRALGLALAVALLASAPRASAQSTTSNTTFTTITSPNGSISLTPNAQGVDRDRDYYSAARPWWISYEDCIAPGGGDAFTFKMTIRDTSDPLEIWAGTENCAVNRSRTDRGQCWIVARLAQLSDTVSVRVPVRNILQRRLDTTDPPPETGLPPSVCDNSTDPSGEAFTFYVMLVDGGQADEYIAWDGGSGGTGFDVVGPDPPGGIDIGIGESQLAISLSGVEEDTDRESFEAFCVPAGTTFESLGVENPFDDGVAVEADAGASGLDAGQSNSSGSDAGGAAPSACFTEVLRAGRIAPSRFGCGTARETSGTLNTGTLQNDTQYAVAVSARDNLGNAGVVSSIECGMPTELDDFFELYSRADGKGGGGFCSIAPGQPSAKHAPRGLAVLLLALAGLGLRRTKGAA